MENSLGSLNYVKSCAYDEISLRTKVSAPWNLGQDKAPIE